MDERGVLCADEIDLEEALDDLEILKRAMTLVYTVEVGMTDVLLRLGSVGLGDFCLGCFSCLV